VTATGGRAGDGVATPFSEGVATAWHRPGAWEHVCRTRLTSVPHREAQFLGTLHGPLIEDARREIRLTLRVAAMKEAGRSLREIEATTGATRQEVKTAAERVRRPTEKLSSR
jgi:hypothetical protein